MCLGISGEGKGGQGKGRNSLSCCSSQGIEDAKKVCRIIGVNHYVLDFKKELNDKVISPFVDGYLKGRTLNPCVLCNRYLKFGALLEQVKSLGIDYLATGHYAGILKKDNRYLLKRAKNLTKDQSYFLYSIKKEILSFVMFPLENFTKQEIRAKVRKLNLSVYSKPASQDVCFIPFRNYWQFLKDEADRQKRTIMPGLILDLSGNILGKHKGVCFYTVGQRQGFGIAARRPLYVIRIDYGNNNIIVGYKEDNYAKGLIVGSLNLFIEYPQNKFSCGAKIRYNHQGETADIFPFNGDRLKLIFNHPQLAIASGQSVVLYKDDTVLGGGIIEQSFL